MLYSSKLAFFKLVFHIETYFIFLTTTPRLSSQDNEVCVYFSIAGMFDNNKVLKFNQTYSVDKEVKEMFWRRKERDAVD